MLYIKLANTSVISKYATKKADLSDKCFSEFLEILKTNSLDATMSTKLKNTNSCFTPQTRLECFFVCYLASALDKADTV